MKRLTNEIFIINANIKHNNKYDYSLINYINTKTKIDIICPKHGLFSQKPEIHLNGSECPKCSYEQRGKKCKSNVNTFISKCVLIHNNKYNYSLVNYVTTHTKVIIICDIHGEFRQTPAHHLSGSGCNKCNNNIHSKEYLLSESKKIHNNYYDYSKINFINGKSKVSIICPKHGEFNQTLSHHHKGVGCPSCKESKGERNIRNYLIENNIDFISQKRFKDCKYVKTLPFDFYLPEYNICIEYDGEQHYKSKSIWGGQDAFIKTQIKDKIKTDYCKNNNIRLIRIKYNEEIIIKL